MIYPEQSVRKRGNTFQICNQFTSLRIMNYKMMTLAKAELVCCANLRLAWLNLVKSGRVQHWRMNHHGRKNRVYQPWLPQGPSG